MLRIVFFEEPSEASRALHAALEDLGHVIVSRLVDARLLAAETQRLNPDAIVVVTRSLIAPQLSAIETITQQAPCPILVCTEDPARDLIVAAVRSGASAYVVGAHTRANLTPVLDAAIARFEQLQALRAEVDAAQARLSERKLVERAKGILMRSRKLNEEDAYRAMRKQAMDRKLKLTEVARQIIAVADLLG